MNQTITIVTTFNQEIWENYANRSINTWFDKFPKKTQYYFFTDTFKPIDYKNIIYFDDSQEKKDFINRNLKTNRPLPKNVPAVGRRWWIYCHKVFAQYEAAKHSSTDYLLFLDADVACLNDFNQENFKYFIKDNFCGFMGRDSLLTETGLLLFDLSKHYNFFKNYIDLYLNDKLFNLNSWCDCGAFDYARSISNENFINLSGEYSQFIDPISVGEIGIFFDHWIGKKSKSKGFSKHRKFRGKL